MENYEKKDFRQLYENLVRSDWFKRAYNNKSIGECPFDIPELHESEDERIRKELIDILEKSYEFGGFTLNNKKDLDRYLAYLERQKEQTKPWAKNAFAIALRNCLVADSELTEEQADTFTNAYAEDLYKVAVGELDLEVCKEDLEDFKKKQKAEGNGTDGDIMQYIEEGEKRGIKEVISFPEKYGLQKEQKSTAIPERIRPKFSVGDTVCRKGYADHTVIEIYLWKDPVYICKNDEGLESHISFSEQDKWEKKEQKPVGWSEKDESILNNIIAYKYLNVDDLEWMKELPKRFGLQPKQEWDEEDETTIQAVIELLKTYFKEDDLIGLSNLKTAISPNDLVKRLKSLRPQLKKSGIVLTEEQEKEFGHLFSYPHWKPTDEQYYALRDAIIKLDADDSDARFPWEGLPTLHSLANDLFELRKK